MSSEPIVVGIGELLWDMFPAGKKMGGAPANFAYHAKLLGSKGIIASRVGTDALGDEVLALLAHAGLDTSFVQRDQQHATGTVQVTVTNGQPSYEIVEDVAWDACEWTDQWKQLAAEADAVCFGTLAQRLPVSKNTIQGFLRATKPDAIRLFDVNLRGNYYDKQVITDSLRLSTILKVNHEEFPVVADMADISAGSEEERARQLLKQWNLQMICITKGAHGSLFVTSEQAHGHPGYSVTVQDTVGSGDAFCAAIVHGLLRGDSLKDVAEAASRRGAWVATQEGAMPHLDSYGPFLSTYVS